MHHNTCLLTKQALLGEGSQIPMILYKSIYAEMATKALIFKFSFLKIVIKM